MQASTEQPVVRDSGTLYFRIQGLSQSTLQEAEQTRVCELINRIERHPHLNELEADLKQDNVHNPFSENSRKLIHDTGNAEYFELYETDSQVQLLLLSYWGQDSFF